MEFDKILICNTKFFPCIHGKSISFFLGHPVFLSNSSLSQVRLGVDFVLPLSQEQQEQEEQQEPPPKISAVTDRILMKL